MLKVNFIVHSNVATCSLQMLWRLLPLSSLADFIAPQNKLLAVFLHFPSFSFSTCIKIHVLTPWKFIQMRMQLPLLLYIFLLYFLTSFTAFSRFLFRLDLTLFIEVEFIFFYYKNFLLFFVVKFINFGFSFHRAHNAWYLYTIVLWRCKSRWDSL